MKEVEESKEPISAQDFSKLANTFLGQSLFDEAITLLENACRLFPDNLTLKIQLGKARSAKIEEEGGTPTSKERKLAKNLERANIAFGMGTLNERRQNLVQAQESYESAIEYNPYFHAAYLRAGMLFYKRREYKQAVEKLTRSRALNPFCEDSCYYLALAYFYIDRHEEALITMIDALVLSGDLEKREPSPYQQKIRLLMEKCEGFDQKARNKLIRERRERFQKHYKSLADSVDSAPLILSLEVDEAQSDATPPALNLSDREHTMLTKLRKCFIFRNLDDNFISKLAVFAEEIHFKLGDKIYKEGNDVKALYLVDNGDIEIVKETPYGNIRLLEVSKGRFFADEYLLFGDKHKTTAVIASSEASLLVIDRSALLNFYNQHPDIALHFFWYFWKNLSFQIREANEQLKSFFTSPEQPIQGETPEHPSMSAEPTAVDGEQKNKKERRASIAIDQRVSLLKSHDLDTEEMELIAKMSREQVFQKGEFVFHEGDPGDALYLIASGKILISKKIKGVGDEALAVLSEGEFFGEMALVDSTSRSADAKAQTSSATVLAIDREILKELLSMDTTTAKRFLTILYRILNKRLAEIREKIYQWKVMAGGF